jgi:hypothetical protein
MDGLVPYQTSLTIKFYRPANPAQFWWKWAGLAVLFSMQLLNGSQDFFFVLILIFKYKTMCVHFWHLIFQL